MSRSGDAASTSPCSTKHAGLLLPATCVYHPKKWWHRGEYNRGTSSHQIHHLIQDALDGHLLVDADSPHVICFLEMGEIPIVASVT